MSKHHNGTATQAAASRQGAVMDLIRTADDLRRYFAALYEPHGLASQQYNVLRILRGARPEALPTMEIAARMVEKTPGITRLIDRLEGKGLVLRERPARDRRRILISITDEGVALLDVLEDPVRDATAGVLDPLDPGEVDQLKSLLARIRGAL